ncbi:MAG: thioredoxin domain-containing protein, partial [Planctomycetaceae bacterium]|nr:thioredoxin domain-containing protein [Planctomycetaceae bacterium]
MKLLFPAAHLGAALFVLLLTTTAFAQDQTARHTNHLAGESSPYLLLHAHNPVDWYPWGPEALERARTENKPIFLSVGYSSCYWCHVMERRVFENEEIAAYMNEHFVNIKVDREERPDLDEIYMLSLQVYLQLAGSQQGGGWPLSLFLTPDGKPIAGGTYFPPEDAPGRPGFLRVLQSIQAAWAMRPDDVKQTADLVTAEVKRLSQPQLEVEDTTLSTRLVNFVVENVKQLDDADFGGLDFNPEHPDAPKFPVPSRLALLQHPVNGAPAADSLAIVDRMLDHMADGGIHDHLGGGFHRYSTDRQWHVPH